ncbi:hypothetical protein [Pleomorphovibrio marinus]|uniref:hypothetical protein n=1 Tax=Pleomorphovibrio marinus TaxID=2164132 RepID=UPI000E0C0603|nr:hypothetical protein [Pleomorphovibrio marinus]
MKLHLPFLTLTLFLSSLSALFGQIETSEFMDYESFKHELSVDVKPFLEGSAPMSLFYRRHTQKSDASPGAFRLQINVLNNFSYGPGDDEVSLNNNFTNMYGIQVGKEWQKPLNNRMMAYTGFDVGFGYGSFKSKTTGFRLTDRVYSEKQDVYLYTGSIFFGVKHHFHQRISISAEFSIQPHFQRAVEVTQFGSRSPTKARDITDSFGLRLIPLDAIRLSYHF